MSMIVVHHPGRRGRPRCPALWWFIFCVIVGVVLVIHISLFSYSSTVPTPKDDYIPRPPRPREPTRNIAETKTETEAQHVGEVEIEKQAVSRPGKRKEEVRPKPLSNRTASSVPDFISSSPTCADGKHAIDEDGNPCIDLQKQLRASVIFVADAPGVNYVVCAIPKNGCSYHIALVNRISGVPDYENMSVIHNKPGKDMIKLATRDTSTIAELLSNETIPKYVVVRNPLRRTLSAYLDKVYGTLSEADRTVEKFHEWLYKEFPGDTSMEPTGKGTNPHWRSQLSFCGFRVRDVDSYFTRFRVEEPEEYVDFLYKHVPGKFLNDGWARRANLSFRDHVLGPRKRTQNTGSKFDTFFNKLEVFDHMAKVFDEDIKLLGYETEVKEMRANLAQRLGLREGRQRNSTLA